MEYLLSLRDFGSRVTDTAVAFYFNSLASKLRKNEINVYTFTVLCVKRKSIQCVNETTLKTNIKKKENKTTQLLNKIETKDENIME